MVLAGPDRHGGDPYEWFEAARDLADTGITVVALCSPAIATTLRPLTSDGVTA